MATSSGPNPLLALTPSQVNWAESEQWRQIVRQAMTEARVAIPAFVTEDLDPVTQTVTVQIAIQEQVRTKTGPQWWDVPPIIKVPIVIPRGGGFSITIPIKKGDEGLLIFCDACIDFWWANGQNNAPKAANADSASGSQTQNEIRRHWVHDCGFLPGMYSQPNVLTDYATDSLQIRSDDGNTVIEVTATEVNVTAPDTVHVKSPAISADNGGTALALVNDNFYQWFIDTYMPSVQYVSSAPSPPTNPETTVLMGQ